MKRNYAGLPIGKRRGFKDKMTSTITTALAKIITMGDLNKR